MWTWLPQDSLCSWWPLGHPTLPCPHCSWCLCVADSLGGGSEGPCFCPTPCNLTRYGKEISMVRIPNRGSARYLARKYNRNETYIRYVCVCVCVRVCVWWRPPSTGLVHGGDREQGAALLIRSLLPGMFFTVLSFEPIPTHPPSHIRCLHLHGSPWSKCLLFELPSTLYLLLSLHVPIVLESLLCVFFPQQPGAIEGMLNKCRGEGEKPGGLREQ